jgi:Sec-independent protein translocase protein TatA
MAGIGFWGFIILGVIIVLVFGTARFGRAIGGLKTGGRELKRELTGKDELPPPPPPS